MAMKSIYFEGMILGEYEGYDKELLSINFISLVIIEEKSQMYIIYKLKET
jgi:hypothetical protein